MWSRAEMANMLFVKVCLGLPLYFTVVTPLHHVFNRCSAIAHLACTHQAVPVPGGWRKGHIFKGIYFLITVGLKQNGINDWCLGELSPSGLLHQWALPSTFCFKSSMKFCSCTQMNCRRWDTLFIICICSTLAAEAQDWCPVLFRGSAAAGRTVSHSS